MLANGNLFFYNFVGKNVLNQYGFEFLLSDLVLMMLRSPAM